MIFGHFARDDAVPETLHHGSQLLPSCRSAALLLGARQELLPDSIA